MPLRFIIKDDRIIVTGDPVLLAELMARLELYFQPPEIIDEDLEQIAVGYQRKLETFLQNPGKSLEITPLPFRFYINLVDKAGLSSAEVNSLQLANAGVVPILTIRNHPSRTMADDSLEDDDLDDIDKSSQRLNQQLQKDFLLVFNRTKP